MSPTTRGPGSALAITCKGGPFDGQIAVVGVSARIYWIDTTGHLIANTSDLEWRDWITTAGAYTKQSVHAGTRDVLVYHTLPQRS